MFFFPTVIFAKCIIADIFTGSNFRNINFHIGPGCKGLSCNINGGIYRFVNSSAAGIPAPFNLLTYITAVCIILWSGDIHISKRKVNFPIWLHIITPGLPIGKKPGRVTAAVYTLKFPYQCLLKIFVAVVVAVIAPAGIKKVRIILNRINNHIYDGMLISLLHFQTGIFIIRHKLICFFKIAVSFFCIITSGLA